MKLKDFDLNPDNPREVSEEVVDKLVGKLTRVPDGLKAIRIAYVTDMVAGKKIVLSGNTRLRALKKMYGEDGECPDEWFQNITYMTPAQRHEFIVSSNVNDGEWDLDKLLKQYDVGYLNDLGMTDITSTIPTDVDLEEFFVDKEKEEREVKCEHCGMTFTIEDYEKGYYVDEVK